VHAAPYRARGTKVMGSDILETLRSRVTKARGILAALFVVAVAGISIALISHSRDVSQKSAAPAAAEPRPPGISSAPGSDLIDLALVQNSRPIYPYSIIPGGVSSAVDLKSAIANDPVVASHYSGFDLAKARVVRLDKELRAYVSYRMGNNVYWTSHKLAVRAGESILTDGRHLARTHCGNRLSETAVKPINSKEPLTAELETPELLGPTFSSDGPVVAWIPSGPFAPQAPPPGSDQGGFIPPFVPIFFGGGSPNSPSHPHFPKNPIPPLIPIPPVVPPNPTPEPGTLMLIATGFSVAWSMRRKFKLPKH
jgi:PEP-CTERM motif-containing protein